MSTYMRRRKRKWEIGPFYSVFLTFMIRIPKRWLIFSHFFPISHERKSPGIRFKSVAKRERPPIPTVVTKKKNSKM